MDPAVEAPLRSILMLNDAFASHSRNNIYQQPGPMVERDIVNQIFQMHAEQVESNSRVIRRLMAHIEKLEGRLEEVDREDDPASARDKDTGPVEDHSDS